MFGSIDAWFYRTLAGITIDKAHPGFKHIIIKPYIPQDISFVDASLNTIRGKVRSRWDYADGDVRLRVVIPVNSSAMVYIPAQNKEEHHRKWTIGRIKSWCAVYQNRESLGGIPRWIRRV